MKTFFYFRLSIVLFSLLLAINYCLAQDDFQAFQKAQQQAFNEFKSKQDKEFVTFLENDWKEFQAFSGMVRDKTPKIKEAPVIKPIPLSPEPVKEKTVVKSSPQPEPAVKKPQPVPEIKKTDQPEPKQPKPEEKVKTAEPEPVIKPVVPEPVISKMPETVPKLSYSFYTYELDFPLINDLKKFTVKKADKDDIADAWKNLSNMDYESFLKKSLQYRETLKLNDWGYCLMLHGAAQRIFPGKSNEPVLFVWFILSKAGYDSRIGYYKNSVYLLLPARQMVYGVTYFTIEGKKYFLFGFDELPPDITTLYTYDGKYPGADKPLDFNISPFLMGEHEVKDRHFRFNYNGHPYQFDLKYLKPLVDYYQYYPQTDMDVYFRAGISPVTGEPLLSALTPLIKGKTETEAVNILLRFVQTAFEYKTDPDQFGREKPLFMDESLYYPYNDCEDRSVLFSYLVKNLLGLEVIGLDYPGHIATAVKFNQPVGGDRVIFNDIEYVICDPTYINANVGMCMPNYKGVSPVVIAF